MWVSALRRENEHPSWITTVETPPHCRWFNAPREGDLAPLKECGLAPLREGGLAPHRECGLTSLKETERFGTPRAGFLATPGRNEVGFVAPEWGWERVDGIDERQGWCADIIEMEMKRVTRFTLPALHALPKIFLNQKHTTCTLYLCTGRYLFSSLKSWKPKHIL